MPKRNTRYGNKEKIALLDNTTLALALNRILDDAQLQRELALAGGIIGDGGAHEMEIQVAAYVDGKNDVIPVWLQDYVIEIEHEEDEEFSEYRRLHAKFGGRTPRKERKALTKIPHWTDKQGNIINKDLMADFR